MQVVQILSQLKKLAQRTARTGGVSSLAHPSGKMTHSTSQSGRGTKVEHAFVIVSNVAEISRLNKQLAKQLRVIFRHKESREITYPSGHHRGTVYFESSSGTNVRAWSPVTAKDKLLNFVLSADPGSPQWIEIAVQLNFPAGTYNRRMAGAFVKDATGEVFLAHRGKLTKGKAGLPKVKVFREFAVSAVEAEDNGQTSRVILIASLSDPALADRLWEFAEEAREVATRLGEEMRGVGAAEVGGGTPSVGSGSGGASRGTAAGSGGQRLTSTAERLLNLRRYFDEYTGEGRTKGYGGGSRTVEHGAVVRALAAAFRGRGDSQKSQAIDLAIVATSKVDLFEVKTSSQTTDVYTGVGQLIVHGECIKDLLKLEVKRYLVLPTEPKPSHGRAISGKGDIKVVTYKKAGASYQFNGLS